MIKSFFNANMVSKINTIHMTKEFEDVIAGNKEIVVEGKISWPRI